MVRIRKNAVKLLGSDYIYTLPPPPPPPPAAILWVPQCGGGGEEEVIRCRLNCSPWDVVPVGPNSSWFFQGEGEEEEGRDIMGNGLKLEEYEEIIATFESISSNADAVDLETFDCGDYGTTKSKKKIKKKKKKKMTAKTTRIKKRKVEVDIACSRPVVVICSKNDGKGWHCKRPANPGHALCNHHLDQLRSYSFKTNNNRDSYDNSETDEPQAADESVGNGVSMKNHRPKAVAAATETAGDGFYYYSGFGSWRRGKKRSTTAGGSICSRANADTDDEKGEERMNESGDGSDGRPVAGDDLDDDDNIEDNIENKGRVVRKKGRKRVKARSLKSLM